MRTESQIALFTIKHVALVGCGNMGSAMARAWLLQGLEKLDILQPSQPPDDILSSPAVRHYSQAEDFRQALRTANIVILAVKPQIMGKVCKDLKDHIPPNLLIASIAAGKTTQYFREIFKDNPLLRAMPNTPAAIKKGITALYGCNIDKNDQLTSEALFSSIGKVTWLDDESLMDAITALSGSGPAYLFLMMEILAHAGKEIGLPEPLAAQLARQTIIGAAALAETSPDISPKELRENVTSPNGTTAAALSVLMDGRWEKIMEEALSKASDRSKALASSAQD